MATRTGKVILAKGIRLDKDYKNIIDYTESSMVTLCQNRAVGQFNNCSFLRPDKNIIDVNISYGDALKANYIAFQNPDYSYKWFFAFIDKVEYISNNNTRFYYTIDECSTWYDYWTLKSCFVVREHTNDDTVGSNLIPENLETGKFIMNGTPTAMTSGAPYYVINADKAPSTGSSPDTSTYYAANIGGLPIAGNLFLFTNWQRLQNAMFTYSSMDGGLDHVKNVFVGSPLVFQGADSDYVIGTYEDDDFAYYKYIGKSSPVERTMTISAPTTINGYTPRNKKLLSSPYQYAILTNNNGSANELNYEYFSDRSNIVIKSKGVPCVGGSVIAYPLNYKGVSENFSESIVGGKFPTLSWSGDSYTNWLTQNAVNIRNSVIGETATVAGGIALGVITGGAGGAMIAGASLLSGAKSAGEMLQQQSEQKKIPNSFSGNINGGDVITSNRTNDIYIWKMSITAEFAQVIDNYFDLYGYKTLKVKLPNQTGRSYWNYVQIGDGESIGTIVDRVNTASVPSASMDIINRVYQKGVTIWHNHDNIGNYNLNNTII